MQRKLPLQDPEACVREASARALGCLGRDGLNAIMSLGGLKHEVLEASHGRALLSESF